MKNKKCKVSKKKTCRACKGTGVYNLPRTCAKCQGVNKPSCIQCRGTGVNTSSFKCMECAGEGQHPPFQMIFWPYDQFPYVLGAKGWLYENGQAWLPSYMTSVKPCDVLPLKHGRTISYGLYLLKNERNEALAKVRCTYSRKLKTQYPFVRIPE